MRSVFATIAIALSFSLPLSTQAGDNAVVVELYTSQGCSSCPPADALLDKLAARDDVIALALHVDYWDYIGWKDNFGSPAYTARQKSYALAAGHRTIYTPQIVIGGTDQIVGNKPMEVVDLINAKSMADSDVDLDVVRRGGKVEISARMTGGAKRPMIVQLVRYIPRSSVHITRGENAGKTIEYTNIVTEWEEIGRWNGASPLRMNAKATGSQPVVIILQAAGPGQVLAAALLR